MEQNVAVQHPKKPAGKEAEAGSESRPWWPLSSLRSEIDHLFDDFTSSWPFATREPATSFGRLPAAFRSGLPATDVKENTKAFVVTVDLPGVEEKDIDVSVSDDVLAIRAEATEERKEEKENYFLSERQHGALQRAFRVPSGVDCDKIDAKYAKGVLTVTMPKTADAQQKQRKIKVQAK
jgi:HSP20 family protein